jgi:hypothetical protein
LSPKRPDSWCYRALHQPKRAEAPDQAESPLVLIDTARCFAITDHC